MDEARCESSVSDRIRSFISPDSTVDKLDRGKKSMKHLSESSDALAASLEQSSCWYRAATLTERTACWSGQDAAHLLLRENGRKEKAEHALQGWKARRPFSTGTYFAERLAMDSITEQDLLALLQEPLESLQERLGNPTAPDWIIDLLEALQTDLTAFPSEEEQEKTFQGFSILQPFAPLLYRSVANLHIAIQNLVQEYEVLPFDPQTILSLLLSNLFQQIRSQVSKTVVLELNIARLRGQLQGENPQERFQEYLRLLRQRSHLLPLLQEYCVLVRHVLRSSQLWAENSQTFLQRLCADWQEIRTSFTPEQDPGTLTAIVGGAGDPHRGGQSVMILTFHAGWQLVYKPRTLAIDAHFQELLAWLNTQGTHPPFRLLKLITKASHGWTEFIVPGDCASEEEVRRFYERQGGYLAILYVLEASDFHHENVMAGGEYPLLIDLEALLQPRFSQDEGGITLAQQALDHSVLHSGLLPMHIFGDREGERFDISGLALQSEGQLSPLPFPQWEGEGTDEMRLVRKHIEMKRGYNCPRLHNQDVQPLDYLEQIVSGFTALYRLLLTNREALRVNWLPRFAQDEIRSVPRATRAYALLVRESFHPNQLRDGLKRERFFDYLWMDVPGRPILKRLIPAERADLLQGDIPLFTTHPESRDIWTSRGECLPEFFERSGLELVYERLQRLSEQDLFRQVWLIRASFVSKAGERTPPVSHQPERSSRALYQGVEDRALPLQDTGAGLVEALLAEAQAIGDWLCAHALQDEEQADWFGIDSVGKRVWQVTRAGLDLSSGLPGILLFLAYLGQLTKEARYTALAQAGVRTLRKFLESMPTFLEHIGIGAFTGLGSCIYLFSHLAPLWQDRSLLQEAEELVRHLPELIKKDEQYNLVDGAAGCLASLLSLYSVAPSEQTLQMGKLCGEHLLFHSQLRPEGLVWEVQQQEGLLSGFSHGVAGIAWSLLRLAAVSGEERFRAAAGAALNYEHRVFSAEQDNQFGRRKCLDNTEPQANPAESAVRDEAHSGMSWSSGAPDIALGRLVSLSDLDDAMMRAELETALETTLTQGFGYSHEQVGPNHSLAHGDCGNLEVVLVAAQKVGTVQLHEALERQKAQLLENIQQCGWIMGVPLNVPTPGLMLGLAGMGYQCLRLAEPERVPSVLSLAPSSADHLPPER
jgi:type 2 lantibiotic biosynthesis protein LanM